MKARERSSFRPVYGVTPTSFTPKILRAGSGLASRSAHGMPETLLQVSLPAADVTIPRMEKRGQATDRHGRTWVARVGFEGEAEEEDFRFWYEDLTPEERVRAAEDCLLSALKAKGVNEIPRLRRVSRVVERKRR